MNKRKEIPNQHWHFRYSAWS